MADAQVFALTEEIIVSETVPVSSFFVEVLALDQTFIPFQELRSAAAARQTLIQPPFARQVSNYVIEVLAEVELEPMPQAKVMGLTEEVVWSEIPTPTVQNYVVEVLATSALDQEVSSFMVEVLATSALDQEVSSFMVEVLGDDTSPNSVASFIVEVLADSTDPVNLTQQTITWFFNDH